MRLCLFIVTLYALTLVQCLSLPDPNVKCVMECDTQENNYICAADDKGTTKTYRNICIMKTENCLQNASEYSVNIIWNVENYKYILYSFLDFQKISDKECP